MRVYSRSETDDTSEKGGTGKNENGVLHLVVMRKHSSRIAYGFGVSSAGDALKTDFAKLVIIVTAAVRAIEITPTPIPPIPMPVKTAYIIDIDRSSTITVVSKTERHVTSVSKIQSRLRFVGVDIAMPRTSRAANAPTRMGMIQTQGEGFAVATLTLAPEAPTLKITPMASLSNTLYLTKSQAYRDAQGERG